MMIYEMTYQVRVAYFDKGLTWYKTLLNRDPDFVPHEGFAEWELIPGCWLQDSNPNCNKKGIKKHRVGGRK